MSNRDDVSESDAVAIKAFAKRFADDLIQRRMLVDPVPCEHCGQAGWTVVAESRTVAGVQSVTFQCAYCRSLVHRDLEDGQLIERKEVAS